MKIILKLIFTISINIFVFTSIYSQSTDINVPDISAKHADKYGKLLVQDLKGRIKPLNTLNLEILRKISRKDKYKNLSANQIVLGMAIFPEEWKQIPIIKVGKHKKLLEILNTDAKHLPYNSFFDNENKYKLRDYVRQTMQKETRDRGSFDKEILKLDERINIFNMIIKNRLLNIFPSPYNSDRAWLSPNTSRGIKVGDDQNLKFIRNFTPAFELAINEAITTNNWTNVDKIVDELDIYQQSFGGVLPSKNKINSELFLNKSNIFSNLRNIFGILGLILLIVFFIKIFKPNKYIDKIFYVIYFLIILAFLYQTSGLILRWYISGRAPWSNGYESLIYISFTTMLAGVIFGRKSWGGLASALILSSVILMVAGLSLFDPEITPLVPVLKSYWLTIHVSLIAGSYGFLMLGAILGFMNLILIIFINSNNKIRVTKTIKELTIISEMTLLVGLVMVAIGTHLGGIWANESWGRYWGWDPKETWALVTVLIYTFILHMRFIPGLKGLFSFNFSTLIGFASVMMTYFGVNYYLSGLHSYAAGDPLPIPPSVYYTAIILGFISIIAFFKSKKIKLN